MILTPLNKQGGNQTNGFKTQAATNYFAKQGILKPLTGAGSVKLPTPPKRVVTPISEPVKEPTFGEKVKTKVSQFLTGTPATVKTVEPNREAIKINQPPVLDANALLKASETQLQKVTAREQQIKEEVKQVVIKNQAKNKTGFLAKLLPGYGEASPELIESLTNQIMYMGAGQANTLLKSLNKEDRKKVEALIYENSNNQKAKQLYTQLSSGRYKDERGFVDGMKEGFVDAGMDVPFGKEIANLIDSASGFNEVQILWEASQKQKNGQPLTDLEKSYVNKQTSKAVMDALSKQSFGYVVGYSLAQMPKFGLEMYLTSGLSAAPNAALKASPVFTKIAAKAPLVEKITRGLISSVPQTLGFTPQAIDKAKQMAMGDPELVLVDGEPMLKYLENKENKKFSEMVIEKLPKALANQYIEVAGERFGEVLDYAGEALVKKLLWKKGVDLAGDIKPSAWQKVLDKMGISSLLSEYSEEVVQGISQDLVNTGQFTIPFSTKEDTIQQLATLLTVGIYGTVLRIPNIGSRARTQAVQEMMDKMGTDVNLTEEEKKSVGTDQEVKTIQQIVAEEEKSPTRITEEQTKASSPAEEKLITRIQTQIQSGNDTFVANLRERVIDNPKLTKDLEAAIAKAEARIAALEQKPDVKEEKPQKVEKQEILYRGGAETSMPKNVTAQEVLNYEQQELGNKDVVAEPGINLSEIKSNNLVWLTTTKKAAREYGKVSAVRLGNYRIVARDGDGGVLVEKLPNKPKIQPKVVVKKKTTSPEPLKQTKKKPVVSKQPVKQAQKPKYTEEQVARAEVAQQTRQMFSEGELKSINDIKRLMNLRRFSEGDIETLRRVRPTEVSDLVEAVRRIENNPDLDDDAALIVALGIPNAAQTKPGYYAANKDALYMAINAREDSGERHVTNEETLKIIRKYFTEKELPVVFVDNLRTRDGGEAWGMYAKDVVSFVNNPTEATPTHEAVHAYLDLFTTPFQKDAYIARTLADARKTMKRAELNSQIRETQLQATQPGQKPVNIITASRIWAEEKMADDFIDYVKGNNKKSAIRRFFDRVIRFTRSVIDPSNVGNLYQDIINKRRDVIRDVLKPQQDYFNEKLDRFKVTTKTLSAMKRELARDVVSRQGIEAYSKRQGITKPDMELIQETLKEFSGEKINVAEFIATVQAKIMPVALIRSSTYADYGTGHLVSLLPKTENVVPADNRFGDNNMMETHIWDTPFRHGQTGHFGADYGDKKLSYEIREVTEPQSGNRVYVVVESGVVLNQENINEAVASTSESREAAEQWIKDHSRDLEVKKSGLLGHTRIASTKTRENVTNYFQKKIEASEKNIEERKLVYSDKKKTVDTFKKNKKLITDRINKSVKEMVAKIDKVDKEWKKLNMTGLSISYLLDHYYREVAHDKTIVSEDKSYDRIKAYEKWMTEMVKGLDMNSEDSHLFELAGSIGFGRNQKHLTQRALMMAVESKYDLAFYQRAIEDEKNILADIKEGFHLALEKVQNKPSVRHLLEVQSDPFQSHYALETDYTKAKDNVKRLEKILATDKETLETFTKQSAENYPPGETERLKKIEDLQNTVINTEADLNLAKRDLEKADAARTSIERQFMAVGSKYHERAIKEEIRLAAHDLLNDQVTDAKFRVPTPLTISFIEGYTSNYDWEVQQGSLVKKGTKAEDILKAQMAQEMPPKPINPDEDINDDEVMIPLTPELKEALHNTGDYVSVDGELWRVEEIREDQGVLILAKESEDYIINEFDDDQSEKSVGDSITYLGSDYTVLAVDGNNLTIASADRVRDYDLDDMVSEQVDSRMDDVYYELRQLAEKYGDITTAAKAQEIIDATGEDNFDYYETGMILKEMAGEDPDRTDLSVDDYDQIARDSLYESEGEYMSEVSYWEDMGYKNVAIYEGSYNSSHVIYAEEDAEVIDVESPDSEYVVIPKANIGEIEFGELQAEIDKKTSPDNAEYQKAFAEYEKKVAEIRAKYAKLEEDLKNKPVPAAVNRDGEYLFNPEATFGDKEEYLTVYKYYEREVLPFFRKFRKDAKLITDENGQQWWETTITKNDQEAVEVYMRKSSFDSLNEMADQLIKSQKIVTKTAKAARKPVDIEGLKKNSKAYSRIVDQMDDLFRQEVSYDQMSIAVDAANALEFVNQHPERALRIAKGLELPPQDITETAISIAMADKARESGNYGLWSELERLRSLRQTRRGQEIVSERGRITENSPEYFLDKVLQERKAIIMNKKGWVYEKKSGKKGVTISEGIKQEVETAKAKVNNRIMNNLESAQDILNRLTCKY